MGSTKNPEALGPVVTAAREAPDLTGPFVNLQAVAVELNFMHPLRGRWRRVDQRCKRGLNELGEQRADRTRKLPSHRAHLAARDILPARFRDGFCPQRAIREVGEINSPSPSRISSPPLAPDWALSAYATPSRREEFNVAAGQRFHGKWRRAACCEWCPGEPKLSAARSRGLFSPTL